jgi:hypothetical protein
MAFLISSQGIQVQSLGAFCKEQSLIEGDEIVLERDFKGTLKLFCTKQAGRP